MSDYGFVARVLRGKNIVQVRSKEADITKKNVHLGSLAASEFAMEQAKEHLGMHSPGVRRRQLKFCKSGTFDVIHDPMDKVKYANGDMEPMLEIEYIDV